MSNMENQLRHSNIAIRLPFSDVARHLGLDVLTGVDDLGEFSFGDVNLLDDENNLIQRFRFASHEFDSMTHLLAQNIQADQELAFILYAAGVTKLDEISISKNQNGKEVRNINTLYPLILSLTEDENHESLQDAVSSFSSHGMHLRR